MGTPEFYFAIEFSGPGVPAGLLGDLTAHVIGHAGCAREEVADLPDALERAVAATGADRRCDVQFRANGGRLEVIVSSNGGLVWQTSRRISS